jgi:hypothetical protein
MPLELLCEVVLGVHSSELPQSKRIFHNSDIEGVEYLVCSRGFKRKTEFCSIIGTGIAQGMGSHILYN